VIEILDERLREISGQGFDMSQYQEEPEDTRISLTLPPEQIREEFMRMALEDTGLGIVPVLAAGDVELFLRRAFTGFDPTTDTRLIPSSGDKNVLRYFIYRFKMKYLPRSANDQWVRMMQRNFVAFNKLKYNSFKKKFADPPANYPLHLNLIRPNHWRGINPGE